MLSLTVAGCGRHAGDAPVLPPKYGRSSVDFGERCTHIHTHTHTGHTHALIHSGAPTVAGRERGEKGREKGGKRGRRKRDFNDARTIWG
jgi:hypothetical protein